jgi:hypothetical protein
MVRPSRPTLQLEDGDGLRLTASWSRSGRRALVMTGTWQGRPWASIALDPEQVESFSTFLTDDAAATEIALDDPDDGKVRMEGLWNKRGNRLALELESPVHRAPVELTSDQASRLADFLRAGPSAR